MTLFAVFLLSVSALSFEVVLTRVFSISQWNHLSFMVISVALFGFAASGIAWILVQGMFFLNMLFVMMILLTLTGVLL